jgi:hypothetical protein
VFPNRRKKEKNSMPPEIKLELYSTARCEDQQDVFSKHAKLYQAHALPAERYLYGQPLILRKQAQVLQHYAESR